MLNKMQIWEVFSRGVRAFLSWPDARGGARATSPYGFDGGASSSQ